MTCKTSYISTITLLCILLLTTCKKENDKPIWDIDVLAPLVNTTMTIGDLIADSLLETAPDGALTLVYDLELFGVSLDTVIDVPDTTISERFGLPIPGPIEFQPGIQFFTSNESNKYELGGLDLSELIIREGSLEHRITSMINEVTVNQFSITNASLAGIPLQLVVNAPAGTPANPSVTSGSLNMAGYEVDLRGPNNNDVNIISTSVTSQIDPNGQPVDITWDDSLIVELSYLGLKPQFALGYLGMEEISTGAENVDIDIFDQFVDGLIDIDQIEVKLIVRNSVGVDAQAVLKNFRSINSNTGVEIDLQHAIINNAININRAVDLGGSVLESEHITVIDNNNSNIDLFFENMPDKLQYDADLFLNPLGNISNGNDFLYYFSEMIVDLEIEMPLCLIATDLRISSTSQIDIGNGSEAGLTEGLFTLHVENFFPFEAQMELFILDENGNPTDQLVANGTVLPGIVDVNNIVVQPVISKVTIPLSPEQVDALFETERIRIDAVFNTADQAQHMKIYDNYYMKLKLVGDFNYLVNGGE